METESLGLSLLSCFCLFACFFVSKSMQIPFPTDHRLVITILLVDRYREKKHLNQIIGLN